MSSWKRAEADEDEEEDEEEEEDLERDYHKISSELDELRGFMMARPDGRILLRDFRLERVKSS